MWWWRKVRRANIAQEERDKFERYGETVVAMGIAMHLDKMPGLEPLVAAAWLTERADLAERREDRLETVEWAVLIFVVVGVIADIFLVLHR
jgi:hypothetical protein